METTAAIPLADDPLTAPPNRSRFALMDGGRLTTRFSVALVVTVALLVAPAGAGASTFSNPTPITMPNAGAPAPASPYQTVIDVDGLTGTVTDANVTIRSFSHACLSDADLLLTGPGGA